MDFCTATPSWLGCLTRPRQFLYGLYFKRRVFFYTRRRASHRRGERDHCRFPGDLHLVPNVMAEVGGTPGKVVGCPPILAYDCVIKARAHQAAANHWWVDLA